MACFIAIAAARAVVVVRILLRIVNLGGGMLGGRGAERGRNGGGKVGDGGGGRNGGGGGGAEGGSSPEHAGKLESSGEGKMSVASKSPRRSRQVRALELKKALFFTSRSALSYPLAATLNEDRLGHLENAY